MKQKIIILLVVFLILPSVYAATLWVNNPSDCPATDATNFPGQDCSPNKICGDSSGVVQCASAAALTAPTSNTTTTSNVDDGSFNGGYLIDCYATADAATPFCDNSGSYWCDTNSTQQAAPIYRQTVCLANEFGKTVQGDCISGRFNCYGDSNCESTTSTDCSGCGGGDCRNSYDTGTCVTDFTTPSATCVCDTNWFACDGSINDADGCEIQASASCGSDTGYIADDECYSSTAGNCTASGARANNRDCDNSDGDNDEITCNSGNGCEITLFSSTNNSQSVYQTCTTFACSSGYLDCNGTGDGTDASGCEIAEGGSCGNSTGIYAAGQCQSGTGNCTRTSDLLDCDNDDSDNNTVTCNGANGCEIDAGTTCGSGTGTYAAGQCQNNTGNCTATGNNLDCDNDDSDSDISTCNGANGCEIVNGGACTVGTLSGTYSGCSGGAGNCVVTQSNFVTGNETAYSSSDALLWGSQYGPGYLINMTNGSELRFGVNNSGCVVFADGTTQCSGSTDTNTSGLVPYANATQNVNLSDKNITTTGTGFFGWLGSLGNFITGLFVQDINASGNVDISGNLTVNTNTLFVDSVNDRIGIGTTNPSTKLEVSGNTTIGGDLNVTGTSYLGGNTIIQTSGDITANSFNGSWNGSVNYPTKTDLTNNITNVNDSMKSYVDENFPKNGSDARFTNLNVTGTSYLGDVTLTSDNITVNNILSRDGGDIDVVGNFDVNGNVNITENLTVNNNIGITNGSLYQPVYGSDDGLRMYLPFSDPNGSTQYDRSPYGNDATTFVNVNCNETLGKYGSACEFDGSTSYVLIPYDFSLDVTNQFTISAWINAGYKNDFQVIMRKSAGVRNFWLTLWSDGKLSLKFLSDTCFILDDNDLRDTGWHYVSATYNGSACSLYLDGEIQGTNLTAGTPDSGGDVYIGSQDGTQRFFNGTIDEPMIYNRALSVDEIRTHYLRGRGSWASGAITADKFRVVNTSGTNIMEVNSTGLVLNKGSFVGNGSELTDVNATWWSGLTGWVTGWFSDTGNELEFNETKLNDTISSEGIRLGFNSTYNATYHSKADYQFGSNNFNGSGNFTTSGTFLQNPNNPNIVGGIKDTDNLNGAYGVYVSGKYAYIANQNNDSFQIIDVSDPTNPTITGGISSADLNGAIDVYVSGKYAYVVSQYDDSLRIIDISNPSSPSIVGGVKDSSDLNGAYGVYVSGKYAYVANSADNSLRIIDISNPSSPSIVGGVKDNDNLTTAKSVYVSGKYAHVVAESDSSLQIIDISDPTNPSIVGAVQNNTALLVVRDVYVSGKYAYTTSNFGHTLSVIDISDPTNPTIVSTINDSVNLNGLEGIYVSGKYAYVISINGDALNIIDISNPTNPNIVGRVNDSSDLDGAIDVYVSGKYAYVTATNDDSLRIIDIGGIDSSGANIGDLAASSIEVSGNLDVGNDLSVSNGLAVGEGGIRSDGRVSFDNRTLETNSGTVTISGDLNVTENVTADYFIGNGSLLTVNSSTWWAGLTGWVSGWFDSSSNELDFNETKLNETIDSRNNDLWTNVSGVATYNGSVNVSGSFDATGDSISTVTGGATWTARNETSANAWWDVAYGNGTFVAVGTDAIMTSSDNGATWNNQTPAEVTRWEGVVYGNGKFVAVASEGTNRTMYSTNGITWTGVDVGTSSWNDVAYGNDIFVAVGGFGALMTSLDGITWTNRTSAEANNSWLGVTYGDGKFVAVSTNGDNQVMYSTDGISWTSGSIEARGWRKIAYGDGKFVASSSSGRIGYSSDGISFTTTIHEISNQWWGVDYGLENFVIAGTGTSNQVATSPDGESWTSRTPNASSTDIWYGVGYGNNTFVVVGNTAAGNRVMTSPGTTYAFTPKLSFEEESGNLGIGTITPDALLDIEANKNKELLRLSDSTNNDSVGFYTGDYSPEGTVEAQIGSLFLDSANGEIYVKTSEDGLRVGWEKLTRENSGLWSNVSGVATYDGSVNITGTSYLGDVTLTSDNITVNNILSKDGNLSLNNSLYITESGNVGIGTITPGDTLTIDDDANPNIYFGNNACSGDGGFTGITIDTVSPTDCTNYTLLGDGTNTFLNANSGGDIYFRDGNSGTNMIIDGDTGNVGIGTITPGNTLNVVGDLNVTGASYLGDITINNGIYQPVYGSDDNLVAYMPFSEPDGSTQYDRSPYGNDGTQNNGATCNSTLGKYGGGCTFDGVNDYVELSKVLSGTGTDITISAWIYPVASGSSSAPYSQIYLHRGDNSRDNLFSFTNSDTIHLRMYDSGGSQHILTSNSALSLNEWTYIVATYDGATMKIYIDGELDNSTSDAFTTDFDTNYDGTYVGDDGFNGWGQPFNGRIDEVMVYERALSEDEIKTHYLRGNNFNSMGAITADKFRVVNTTGDVNFIVDEGGNVGIGDTIPDQALDVNGNIALGDSNYIYLHSDTDTNWRFGKHNFNDVNLYGATGLGRAFNVIESTGGSIALSVEFDGNVGIGAENPTSTLDAIGVYSDTVGATRRDLYVDVSGVIGYVSSSERYKSNITNLSDSDWIHDLRPVSFIRDAEGRADIGLIAEEVHQVNPDLVSYDLFEVINGSYIQVDDREKYEGYIELERNMTSEDVWEVTLGKDVTVEKTNVSTNETYTETEIETTRKIIAKLPETVQYSKLVVPLLKAVQELRKDFDSLVGGSYSVEHETVFDQDMVGTAIILANETRIEIKFEKECLVAPIVTVTPVGLPNFFYGVDEITTKGFKILISETQGKEIVFNWHAFAKSSSVMDKAEEIDEAIGINETISNNITLINETTEINLSIPENNLFANELIVNNTIVVPGNLTIEINETTNSMDEANFSIDIKLNESSNSTIMINETSNVTNQNLKENLTIELDDTINKTTKEISEIQVIDGSNQTNETVEINITVPEDSLFTNESIVKDTEEVNEIEITSLEEIDQTIPENETQKIKNNSDLNSINEDAVSNVTSLLNPVIEWIRKNGSIK